MQAARNGALGSNESKTTAPRASQTTPLLQPPHPPLARSRGEEGTVVLEVFVTEIGEVAAARVGQSSGFAELDAAAMRATEHWKLMPGMIDGMPICMWARFAVVFSLSADGDQEKIEGPSFRPVPSR